MNTGTNVFEIFQYLGTYLYENEMIENIGLFQSVFAWYCTWIFISMIFQSQQVEPDDLPHILWKRKNCTSFQNLTQSDVARRVDDFFSRIRNQVPSPPPGARNERKLLPFPPLSIFQLRIFCEVWCERNLCKFFVLILFGPFSLFFLLKRNIFLIWY